MVLFNRDIVTAEFKFSLGDLGMSNHNGMMVTDILKHRHLGTSYRDLLVFGGVKSHSVGAYVFTPVI